MESIDLKSELQKIISGEVEDNEEVLKKYSRDASVFEVMPKLVVFPVDSNDVKKLVQWVSENCARQDLAQKYGNISITARCAGTDMSGGAIGESIIMDFTRHMNKMISFHEDKITVQPGMFYRDFEKLTLERDLILPCYTASKSLNAMGGMYGNNSAGERTLKYGKTEDYVMEAKVIFADGEEYVIKNLSEAQLQKKITQNDYEGQIYKNIYNLIKENESELAEAKPKVSKNSAGYYLWNVFGKTSDNTFPQVLGSQMHENKVESAQPDHSEKHMFSVFDLNKLLVGSQGTLGITTEITFRLVKNYKHSKLVVVFMKDLGPLGRLVDEILETHPETLETYDDKTMKLAVQFLPDFLKNKGFFGMGKFMFSFMPEFWMMVSGGFPKLILLVEYAGDDEKEVDLQCMKLKEKIRHFRLKTHITESEAEAEKYWDIRRQSFALLRQHVKDKHTAPFIDDIIVRPEFLPKFLPELNLILGQYDITFTIAGHAGDGNFHIIPLMDFSREDTAKIILELGDKVYNLVAKYEGSTTAEHNDGIIRTPYLGKIFSPKILELFAKTKNIFDPKNIFNPGKKVGGSIEYISSHIAREDHGMPHQS